MRTASIRSTARCRFGKGCGGLTALAVDRLARHLRARAGEQPASSTVGAVRLLGALPGDLARLFLVELAAHHRTPEVREAARAELAAFCLGRFGAAGSAAFEPRADGSAAAEGSGTVPRRAWGGPRPAARGRFVAQNAVVSAPPQNCPGLTYVRNSPVALSVTRTVKSRCVSEPKKSQ